MRSNKYWLNSAEPIVSTIGAGRDMFWSYVVLPRRLQESIAAAERGELQEHALVEVQ